MCNAKQKSLEAKSKKKIFAKRQKSTLGKEMPLPRVALGKVELFAKRC